MSFETFSPLDNRYAKDLPASLAESENLRAQIDVEAAWLMALGDAGLAPKISEADLNAAWANVSQAEIDKIEARTQHATRALVETLAERLVAKKRADAAGWVHVGLTSFDCVDTAVRLRLKRFFERDGLSSLAALKAQLRRWAKSARTLEATARTHGQWAVPTYFGLQFAEAHERIETLERRLNAALGELTGQASGAVGGYQASSLLTGNALDLEAKHLKRLGLKPHYGSTQILPPEDIVAVAQSYFLVASVVAKLANDLRHLARSEIAEISEGLAPGQVGSSTMPQKRNPWNLEHVCSLYKVLQSRLVLLEIDLVSEHQRDLTNSASSRFYPEFFAVAFLMTKRLTKVLTNLEVNHDRAAANLKSAGDSVFAEALYVLGAKAGVVDAHDRVREGARRSEKSGKGLIAELASEPWMPKGLTIDQLRKKVLEGSRLKFDAIAANWKD